jgi:hypothetical protein
VHCIDQQIVLVPGNIFHPNRFHIIEGRGHSNRISNVAGTRLTPGGRRMVDRLL